jgi:CheY-like chemotaxis protein
MRLLIVDDEENIVAFFSALARNQGQADIDTAGSGEEALTRVLRKAYDLITLDIHMPGASGLEVIAMLRNMNPHAIIALVSGYMPEDISSEVANCADVMLPKPVSVSTFNQLLASATQISQIMDQIRLLGMAPATLR